MTLDLINDILGFSWQTALFLVVGALVAGFIDSICGGGGLISVPVLLMAGFTPAQAISANKLQGTLGAITSTYYYLGKDIIDIQKLKMLGIGAMLGGVLGTLCVYAVSNGFMQKILPIMLIIMALYFAFSKKVKDDEGKKVFELSTLGFTFMPLIGFYDGFFGPGAGTFYMAAMISLAGMSVTSSVAYSRVLNLISNLASLLVFLYMGNMAWSAGIMMSIGEVIGVYFGSKMVFKNGAKLVKPLVVIACIAMAIQSIVRA